ncbi:hypothetical protein [Streptomyces sp. NPDC101393]|uniref:hypothetical protein n=1 Tax=Streptomyces sp. NPDC101393 TaxID=3366141 RepID=UPI0037FD255F
MDGGPEVSRAGPASARDEGDAGDDEGMAGVTAAWRLRRLPSEDPAARAELRALLGEPVPERRPDTVREVQRSSGGGVRYGTVVPAGAPPCAPPTSLRAVRGVPADLRMPRAERTGRMAGCGSKRSPGND